MSERPILFSAPMVRALLDGRKTQTRRVLPGSVLDKLVHPEKPSFYIDAVNACPYGAVGDRLWVRETHLLDPPDDGTWSYFAYSDGVIHNRSEIPPRFRHPRHVIFRATWQGDNDLRWMPSIHMPRWASRITLEITGVRVERLQEISEADAKAEGVNRLDWCWDDGESPNNDRDAFECLWVAINGRESWEANPWVWVIEFKRVTP